MFSKRDQAAMNQRSQSLMTSATSASMDGRLFVRNDSLMSSTTGGSSFSEERGTQVGGLRSS